MSRLTIHSLGLENIQFSRMFSNLVPILVIATPGVVAASVVSNTASVTAPQGAVETNVANNSIEDTDDLLLTITATPDMVAGVDGGRGGAGVVNVFDGDLIGDSPATPANALLALAPGSTLPAGISFDTTTGLVDVAAGTPEGEYIFEYQICDIAVPTNCQTATVTIGVVAPTSELLGTVYRDLDGDRDIDGDEPRLQGWIVEISDENGVVQTTTTDADGNYEFTGLPGGREYTITFRNPDTGVVYEKVTGIQLNVASTLPDQNLPIDPSGIIYDSVTRAPVAGAIATLVDRNGNPLPADCYLDISQRDQVTGVSGEYRFDIVPGAAAACPLGETEYVVQITPPAGYSFTSTVLPPQSGSLDPTGRPDPAQVVTSPTPPSGNDAFYFLSFLLENGDPNVTNNHIALDPFLSRDQLIVTKTSTKRSASVGDIVPYEITVRNPESVQRADVDVVDVLPAGMTYVLNSARVNGIAVEPELANGNRELIWRDQVIPPGATFTYSLNLIVGAGVTQGQSVNTGLAENGADGSEISNRGTATVSIIPSTVFDCSELIGQVFVDANGNGYQDDGEVGIPSVRLATVKGELITTDEHGRFHIACAAVPDARIGSNFVLKVDETTLPQGWAMTTDNPRSVRLTRGKMSELNFGVAQADTATVTIDDRAFNADGTLRPEIIQRLQALKQAEAKAMIVRATYQMGDGLDSDTVRARIEAIRAALKATFASDWDGPAPVIQVNAAKPTTTSNEGGE